MDQIFTEEFKIIPTKEYLAQFVEFTETVPKLSPIDSFFLGFIQ